MPQSRTRKIVVTAVLAAITIVLGLLPFGGYIPFAGISITILTIPVIIGAILEGPIVGAGIGLIFGLTSLYQAATAPKSPLDPAFCKSIAFSIAAHAHRAGCMAGMVRVKKMEGIWLDCRRFPG